MILLYTAGLIIIGLAFALSVEFIYNLVAKLFCGN